MFRVLGNAWKIADLRKKILYTLMILLIYRVGCVIPVPGVNLDFISETVAGYGLFSFMDMFSGGSLSSFTVFALGIIPYINASIIMNLLTIAIPALERMSKEGEDGRKKIASITRYVGVGLGLVMAIGILLSLESIAATEGTQVMLSNDWFNYVTIVLTLTAGTALIMWMGERINENGIGNGISLIIFIGIISSLPTQLINSINAISLGLESVWSLVITVVVALIIITGITFVDMGERRIPVQYAKRVVGRKQYGGQTTFIPMKVNQSGVMPLIFAMTLIQFPGMIAQFWPESDFYLWYNTYLGSGSWIYMLVYGLLILFFTYFYSQISFNPIDVSKNMQQHGGFIPGIRPGKPTSDYLARILSKITFVGAIFLAVVAAVPTVLATTSATGAAAAQAFGATSLLIMVSVALETTKQIESQMMMRHYKGFLK